MLAIDAEYGLEWYFLGSVLLWNIKFWGTVLFWGTFNELCSKPPVLM